MENKKPASKTIDALLGEPELSSLVELQKFIADELGTSSTSSDFGRSFRPLTDGLGLESPDPSKHPKPTPIDARLNDFFSTDPLPAKKTAETAPPPKDPLVQAFQKMPDAPPPLPVNKTAALFEKPASDEISPTESVAAARLMTSVKPPEQPVVSENPETVRELSDELTTPPPELPRATLGRRFMAALLDQIFVWTLFAALVILTGVVLEGLSPSALSQWFFSSFSNAKFLRVMALEFSVIWLTYLVFSIGVLDMTFGMWVWGLRLSYPGAKEGEWLTARRCVRLVTSFLVYPIPVLTPFLFIRNKGRNLVDMLSGTTVYRFAQ